MDHAHERGGHLLPRDPDGSAARIREAVRDRLGTDLAIVVSDSFGRPWRWGIVDVALGVSGLLPVEDLPRAGLTPSHLRGRWDGGDASDTTYVPVPGYDLEVRCFRRALADGGS